MKTPLALLTIISLLLIQKNYSQDLESSKNLGLIAYLTFIKENSEKKLLHGCKGDNVKNHYLDLKIKTDVLINQFCADMEDKNGLALYRNMNKYLASESNNKRVTKYEVLLVQISADYRTLEKDNCGFVTGFGLKALTGVSDVLSILGIEPYSLFQDIKAKKREKRATLIVYIKGLRLKPLTTSDNVVGE